MKTIRYLCLDDETKLIAKSIRRLQSQFKELAIESISPTGFEVQLTAVQELHRQGALDGLLVDLRLDEKAPQGAKPVRYTATGLAAQLRSWLSTRKQEVVGFPMILWSIENRLAHAFNADESNKDLFDLVLYKEDLPQRAKRSAEEMIGLVKAYRCISSELETAKSFSDMLRPPRSIEVDVRIGQQFGKALRSQPTHSYAQFIFRSLIEHPGPLIDERTLCARLGLDFASSGKGGLLRALDRVSSYKGPYCEAWPRWWTGAIDVWWQKLVPESKALTRISPKERLDVIKKGLKVKGLKIAAPIDSGYSNYFSTVCAVTNEPLDPIDGFVIAQADSYPWQSKRYVCRDVALDPAAYDFREKIDPIELDRLRTVREKARTHGKKGGSSSR